MGKEEEAKKIDKQNKKVLQQNQKMIQRVSTTKMKRHVQVDNEPAFQKLLDGFSEDYAQDVVANSSIEILKVLRDET